MEPTLSVIGNFSTSINFAMEQNYVSVIRSLVVRNESQEMLSALELEITFTPEFAMPYVQPIGTLGPGQAVEITPVKLQMNTQLLFSLTERMAGSLQVSVRSGDTVLHTLTASLSLLAYDEWSGLKGMPELIAAFIMPNHPQLVPILHSAAALLDQWTGSPSFTAYQTQNPNQVKLQMAALYTALAQQGLGYNLPPASFEEEGQRIRLPHAVLEQKQGTCLDLAVLYASCLEAVGLHSLLLFTQGHAFCGCWLEDSTFADCVVDDLSAIVKRTTPGAQELLAVECTDFVAGKNIPFDQAMADGQIRLDSSDSFLCAVDVQRTRGSGIRPIPLLLSGAAQPQEPHAGEVSTQAPAALDSSLRGRVTEARAVTRRTLWERKLLDLSLRNSLLNFRVTKNAIQIMADDLAELENKLADGKDLQLLEIPSEWSASLRDARMYTLENNRDLAAGIAAEELKNGRLRTFLKEEPLRDALKGLYRSAKVSLEENGSNTLFLALGLLRWYESDLSEKARYAPLVLIPVDLVHSVRSRGSLIRSRQEDAQMNVTLLEYLRQDHGLVIEGLDPLPQDSHGVDLPLVLHTVRQAVMAKKRWDIENQAFLGLFSFGQFVMWNDLHSRSEELRENPVVASLMEGRLTWEPEGAPVSAETLDQEIDFRQTAVPVSADSSQMVAIAAAAAGRSFVLHGPPGTGKSQTITNMIANALYQGKSVLFVAEKMAALTVVQNRLAGIGLDPFCLELHSNKTKKTTVLEQLNQALEVGRVKSPEEYEAAADKLHQQRAQLNCIITALHHRRSWGGTLYDAISCFQGQPELLGVLPFDSSALADLTREQLEIWDGCIHRYLVAVRETGPWAAHPLKEVGLTAYTMELREAFRREAETLRAGIGTLSKNCRALAAWLDCPRLDRPAVEAMGKLVSAAALPGPVLPQLLAAPGYDSLRQKLLQLLQSGLDYREQHRELLTRFDPAVLDYDADSARLRWRQAENDWFLPKMAGQNKLLKELRLYAKSPDTVTKAALPGLYDQLSTLAAGKRSLRETPAALASLLCGLFLDTQTDWEAVEQALAKTEALRNACLSLPEVSFETVVRAVAAMDPGIPAACAGLESFLGELDRFRDRFRLELSQTEQEPNWPEALGRTLSRFAAHTDKLRDLTLLNQANAELLSQGLENVWDACRQGLVTADNLERAYSVNLHYGLAMAAINGDPRLRQFHGSRYDDLILQFRSSIDTYRALTIQELAARLSAKVPTNGSGSAASSEMGILKRAIKSGGRNQSLRRLFDQIPTLLRRLCPCMLMSPISVAQYIDPAFPKFDLVIFDEASQLPTSEAVGAIARGENVIVVGDPKQLPPTNFFTANHTDEENSQLEDLESLLDDCLALSMPQEYLKWHYRSRHESLIAYSNMRYYDNKLYTFPSPNDLVSQVKLVPVEGVYDKGKTKQNQAEAQAIVAEIIRRLRDEALCRDSIGVVTFSAVQQNLIDDLLCEEWEKYPELEEQNRLSAEPIFIKNLENVQGDERDVILFSVCYGPDANGQVSMNFGPLNRDGGWRRLNVAISRARKSMVVYSVLRPEQIDLSRTRAEGVAGLKGFLEYARGGKTAMAQRSGLLQAQEDCLADEIAAAISALGYRVQRNIGCSSFKVDIGIVDPEHPDTFLLGILLDGRNSCQAATAQDRFVLQPSVLEGLGWSVLRLWAMDWVDDRERVLSKIRAVLAAGPQANHADAPAARKSFESFGFEQEAVPSAAAPYTAAELPSLGTPDTFYFSAERGKIRAAAAAVLKAEAPIRKKLLTKKVLAAWSIPRSSARSDAVIDQVLESLSVTSTQEGEREFLWNPGQGPEEYAIFRVEPADTRRSMEDVPCQELLNASLEVLREQISLSETDLIRETARKFGYSRIGGVMEGAIRSALAWGSAQGRIARTDSGNFKLPD